ncbi:signal transduction histidine kinase [Collimonas sp. PA-H2]|uniref:sensor histidine kinase n=1 Tax=Collimonas sp. PA-H2 TaxID=1881062 RepID=UPI000BFA7C8C|nr:sensor histidine kinase [Collimonas sp. PA-H2]PFH09633.1 signal transduction histidine kinase [Collimonas sp. PA-H2]
MYSILPAVVASIFLAYGLYVVCTKGFTRIGSSFLVLCITSAFWQGAWAFLFTLRDPHMAMFVVKFGYLLILFLPTSLYHFLTEICERTTERKYVYASYAFAAILAIFLLGSDLLVSGYYQYFWGYYPKAGLLHPLHVLQTVIVVNRGLYITYREQQVAELGKRIKMRLCIGAILIYFFAAVDYLCNYGIEFYPPGVLFIAVSLGVMSVAIVRHHLLDPMTVASTVGHEMRTPLTSIRMLAKGMEQSLPTLLEGYRLAVEHGLLAPSIRPDTVKQLSKATNSITQEVDRTTVVIDMMLASAKLDRIDTDAFANYSVVQLVDEALERYPFERGERAKIYLAVMEDYAFFGSDRLFVFVLFNLLKNSLYALKAASKGEISISTTRAGKFNVLCFTDTGAGIAANVLPHIFDAHYTTKKGAGSGIGLAFCHQVMAVFGGSIRCESAAGEYTRFTLEFPVVAVVAQA